MARAQSMETQLPEAWEEFRQTLDQRIADHLEPLLARVGELERRLGHDDRAEGRSIEERLQELERFERSEQSLET